MDYGLPLLLDTTTTIRTPERVGFRFRIAGPGRRGAAWGVDLAIQAVGMAFVALVAFAVGGTGWGQGGVFLALFLVSWFYGALFEIALQGRTPGKLLLGLRVVTATGAPASAGQIVLRNLLRGADFLPVGYGVGVLAMLTDRGLRRLGDRVGGTMVVDERHQRLGADVVLDPPITAEERRGLPARVPLDKPTLQAIEAFLRRTGDLSEGRAEELAGLLAPSLRAMGVDAPSDRRVLALGWARATGRDRALEEG